MCPAKYYFRKILQLPQPFIPIELAYGTGFHSALEKKLVAEFEGNKVSFDEMMDEFKKAIDKPDVRFNGQTRDELVDEAKELLSIAVNTDFGVIKGIEYPIEVKLGNNLTLNGFIDLLSIDKDGKTIVTDFKTAKRSLGLLYS